MRRWRESSPKMGSARKPDAFLSRDSSLGQWIDASLQAQGCHGFVYGAIEVLRVCDLVGEMMGLEIVPDNLDIVEFG